MSRNNANFIAKMLGLAEKAATKLGMPTSVVLGQWALESAWGTSRLSTKRNNFGGISWPKASVPSWSKAVGTVARPANEGGYYLVYNSAEAFAEDYVTVMQNSRYDKVRQAGQTAGVDDDLKALSQSGYAASAYAQSTLPDIVKSLQKYDKKKICPTCLQVRK